MISIPENCVPTGYSGFYPKVDITDSFINPTLYPKSGGHGLPPVKEVINTLKQYRFKTVFEFIHKNDKYVVPEQILIESSKQELQPEIKEEGLRRLEALYREYLNGKKFTGIYYKVDCLLQTKNN